MSAVEYEIRMQDDLAPPEPSRPSDMESLRPLPRISVHAFCESDALHRVMERLGQDRRMSKVNLRVTSGGSAAAANMFATAPPPTSSSSRRMRLPAIFCRIWHPWPPSAMPRRG